MHQGSPLFIHFFYHLIFTMSKFDEEMAKYREQADVIDLNEDLLTQIAKGLGPSIYLPDASLVSCTDQVEKDRIKKNFLIGKCGLEDDGSNLDAMIDRVCEIMKSSTRKYRAVFYYFLITTNGLESKILN
jgi:hypothetical protein